MSRGIQGDKRVVKFANTSISSLLFAVRASTVAIILIKILLLLILLLLLFSTKDSSAMAKATPKIRSFTLVKVSAELSLKKLSFSTKKRN